MRLFCVSISELKTQCPSCPKISNIIQWRYIQIKKCVYTRAIKMLGLVCIYKADTPKISLFPQFFVLLADELQIFRKMFFLLSLLCRWHQKSDVCYLSQFVMLTKEGQHRSAQYEQWIKTSLTSLKRCLRYWRLSACSLWSFHRGSRILFFFSNKHWSRTDNKSLSSVTLMFLLLAVPWLTVIIVFILRLGVLPHIYKCLASSLSSHCYLFYCLFIHVFMISIN